MWLDEYEPARLGHSPPFRCSTDAYKAQADDSRGRAQLLRSPFGSRSCVRLVLICFEAPVDAPASLADLPSRWASRIAARFWSGPPGLSAIFASRSRLARAIPNIHRTKQPVTR